MESFFFPLEIFLNNLICQIETWPSPASWWM